MAANQVGKTWAGGSEAAMHATGRYPSDWTGRVFNKPTVAWVGSPTALTLRDNPQRVMLGRLNQYGTGTIPKDALGELIPARNVADLMDTIMVKHGGGGDVQQGQSAIGLKSYEQGREKWQGETLDWLWYDEEPDLELYTEGLTRTNVTQGPVWVTFTPLLGMSDTVRRFKTDNDKHLRHVTEMTLDDAEHYSPEARAAIVASYPVHERDARTRGIPILGSGRIFPINEEAITYDRSSFPEWLPLSLAPHRRHGLRVGPPLRRG